jgi:predicted ATPase
MAEVSVPATVQAAIAARIDRLEPDAKQTLNAAAVIGLRFTPELLTALGVEPVVEDLVAAQLIDQVKFTRQPEYVFHHPRFGPSPTRLSSSPTAPSCICV